MYFNKKFKNIITLVVFAFVFQSLAHAKASADNKKYSEVVSSSKDMKSDYNFVLLRSLFQKLPTYKPYNMNPINIVT